MVRTPERRLRGHASFVLPHTESFAATSNVANSSPTIPQHVADKRIQGSELADLDLEPSFVVPASVTVIHPQLRDLVSCPKERGVIYHVKGSSIVELTVDVNDYPDDSGDEERPDEGKRAGSRPSRNKEAWLPITTDLGFGVHTKLLDCLVSPISIRCQELLAKPTVIRHHLSANILACGGQQGELHLTSLPAPNMGRNETSTATSRTPINPWRSRQLPALASGDRSGASWSMTVTLPHASINNSFVLLPPYPGETPLPTRASSPVEELRGGSIYQERNASSTTSPPVATFPNSLPRGNRLDRHIVREPTSAEDDVRTPSFGSTETDNSRRSSDGHPAGGDDGMSFMNQMTRLPPTRSPEAMGQRGFWGTRPRGGRGFRPRHTFDAGRQHGSSASSHGVPPQLRGLVQGEVEPDVYVYDSGITAFGSRTSVGSSQPYSRNPPPEWYSNLLDNSQFPQRPLPPPSSFLPQSVITGEPRLLVSNNDHFVKLFALRPASTSNTGPSQPARVNESKFGSKRLTNIGGVKINTAANHSSLSPDGRTLICVGDNHEVYLYEVISGGSDFRLIRTYRASDDAGFSTSWSKDGKKFAVASQDGVVTVWDHRSSDPLAKLHTRTRHDIGRFDYEDTYYWRSAAADGSRRDPARVVKFSPPGSDRDLLVFSEEGEAIHVVDARTFDVQARLELPIISREERLRNAHHPSYSPTRRVGPDGGRIGIAGIDFDPTGDFLYAGTEAVMVEYDLRRHSRRGVGSWVFA
ncbi:hypothetical protein QFC22_005490 [Naganishia vaughanmartiniae]|uniref:Uncharacterized protein n=1 Tax=Naganishia vaughanmartiniae TaxID=1424756 RepID=A0ACC2WVQ2_9TREE|nr:hypothetical protein QFC22_005490 [Naganishia vaughanmartiniae]